MSWGTVRLSTAQLSRKVISPISPPATVSNPIPEIQPPVGRRSSSFCARIRYVRSPSAPSSSGAIWAALTPLSSSGT